MAEDNRVEREATQKPYLWKYTAIISISVAVMTILLQLPRWLNYLESDRPKLLVQTQSNDFQFPPEIGADRVSAAMPSFKNYLNIAIRNASDFQAEEVELKLSDDKGTFRVERDGGEVTEDRFEDLISIGKLAVDEEISVLVWSAGTSDTLTIVHKSGKQSVTLLPVNPWYESHWIIAYSVFGFSAFGFVVSAVIVALIVVTIYASWFGDNRRHNHHHLFRDRIFVDVGDIDSEQVTQLKHFLRSDLHLEDFQFHGSTLVDEVRSDLPPE